MTQDLEPAWDTRDVVWLKGKLWLPEQVTVEGEHLVVQGSRPLTDWNRHEHLLADLQILASADPEDMAAFMETYGVLQLCGAHGRPPLHALRQSSAECQMRRRPPDAVIVGARDVRTMARAFTAAPAVAAALHQRSLPESADVAALSRFDGAIWHASDEWMTGRTQFAGFLERLINGAQVVPDVRWSTLTNGRLAVQYTAQDLLGILAVLLARECSRGGSAFRCSVCNLPAYPLRPPRPDEPVYCRDPACKREQQRRNQRNWRARQKAAKR